MRSVEVRDAQGYPLTVVIPDASDVMGLRVGDLAPGCFSESEVMEITARKNDVNGKAFVCYYVAFGTDARMSYSVKEDELVRTFGLCNRYKSVELDALERQARIAVNGSPLRGRGMHDCPECGTTVMHGSYSRRCDKCEVRS